jgi:rubrerythrin
MKIVSSIRKKLASDDNVNLSSDDKKKLCQLMNMEMKHEQIVEFMGAKLGTPKGDAIMY